MHSAGIAIEDQPKIFQQFVQFNRNLLQGGGGSGLGLWICKNLATFHGGRMVQSASSHHDLSRVLVYRDLCYCVLPQGFHSEGLGRGSTFSLDLPIYSTTKEASSSTSQGTLLEGRDEAEDEDEDEDSHNRDKVYPVSTGHGSKSSAYTRVPARILIVDDSSMNRYSDINHILLDI